MLTFKGYFVESDVEEILTIIEDFYGDVDTFLTEAAHNIVDHEKFQKANAAAQEKSNLVKNLATKDIEGHLKNYGRSLYSHVDKDDIKHLNDDDLFKERETHLNHLKHLYNTDPKKYKETVKKAQERLPINPHGQNRKTATMEGEKVNGKEVIASVSNRGMSGSVAKIGKEGKHEMRSTCVNSKQSCRGEGPNRIGAPCLGMTGCGAWTGTKRSNTVLENMKTMKAHAKNGATYDYNDSKGHKVKASPHLDYATLEHASLVKATEHAKKESEKTGKQKLAVYRQNTTNEQSAMHHDQVMHNLPDHLKHHLATNNYSATIAKGHYDPKHPSDASTHDGVLNNTNFSVKGPEVVHDDKGKILSSNKSANVKEAEKAMNPEHDEHGNLKRPAQNSYMVAGGHHEGQRLRYPKGKTKKDPETGEVTSTTKTFHENNKPEFFKPFDKLNKVKTARIYHKEIDLKKGSPKDFHHPDGWGHETFHDPHTKKDRTFEYQDHHVHVNAPKADKHGMYDFNKLNDNVGSDDRKPKGDQIKRNKKGHQVGSVHISAATSATSNVAADGTVKTDKQGKPVGDKSGVANDPFTFPIQHHIDKHDESRINLNHPKQQFEAEEQDRKNKAKNTPIMPYQGHPETKAERGELK